MNMLYEVLNWALLVSVLVFFTRELYIAHRGGRFGMLMDALSNSAKEALLASARMRKLAETMAPAMGLQTTDPEEMLLYLARRTVELDAALVRWRVVAHDPQSLLAQQASQAAELMRIRAALTKAVQFVEEEARRHRLHGAGNLAQSYTELVTTLKKETNHA